MDNSLDILSENEIIHHRNKFKAIWDFVEEAHQINIDLVWFFLQLA